MNDVTELILRIKKLELRSSAENLFGQFVRFYAAYRGDLLEQLFIHNEHTRVELPWGVYEGESAVSRAFANFMPENVSDVSLAGEFTEHHLTAPVIFIDDAAKKVTASWLSPGLEAHRMKHLEGQPRIAFWYWGRYEVEMVAIGDSVKIQSMTFISSVVADYTTSFTESPMNKPPKGSGPTEPEKVSTWESFSESWNPRSLPLITQPSE